jgi:putative FmdB family regulatory protein
LHSYNKPRRIRKNQQESSSVPLYEYQCKQCGHRFEKIQSFSAPEEKVCPECGGEVERLISAPAIQFKGAGWYVNDYAGRGKAPSTDRSKGDGSKGDGKDVAAKSSEGSSKVEGGKSDSTSKSDSGTASSNSASNAASAGSGSTAKSSD